MTPRWWVSWHEPSRSINRLLQKPKPAGLLGAWVSGVRGGDHARTVCVLVEGQAPVEVLLSWWSAFPRRELRFFSDRPAGWTPGDRFPS